MVKILSERRESKLLISLRKAFFSNIFTYSQFKFLFLVSYFFLSMVYTHQLQAQCTPPSITTQPVSQTVCEGDTVNFSVTATGTEPLLYQWSQNGVPILGATAATYTIPSATPADSGVYTVTITNACGTVTSDPATLTVNSPPSITTQPVSQTVCEGDTVSFSVTATGTEPFLYQWSQNGVPIPGATAATYTIPSATPADSGAYTVTVTNACGSATSNEAILIVNTPPSITTQPVSQTVCEGDTVTFSVTATGTEPFLYQWSQNGIAIPGATAATYTIPSATPADSGVYTVTVTNACGTVTSDPATLTVNSPPSITTQPVSQTVCEGDTATFSVAAIGTEPLLYQWFKNGIPIPGATSATYTTPPLTQDDNGAAFYVVITNSCGSTTSANAFVTVGSPFTFTTLSVSPTTENGADGSITFIVSSGTGSFFYSINNGVSFETSNVFSGLPAGIYNLVVTNGCSVQTCTVILYSPLVATTRINTPLFISDLGFNIISYTQPSHGTVTINADGTIVYQPDVCFSGNDSFTYTITNPCGQITNTVLLIVSFWTSALENPADPIYNPFPEQTLSDDYYPYVLFNRFEKDCFVYRMWHQGPDGIAMSESHDGIHWKFVSNTNLKGMHPCVIFDERGFKLPHYDEKDFPRPRFRYRIWFWTGEVSSDVKVIQYSYSNDGIHWLEPHPIREAPGKPLVFGDPGTPFYQTFGPGFVLFNPSAKSIKGKPYTFPYVMFYDVSNGSSIPGAHSIGLAYSKDGIHWKRYGSRPILNPSGDPTAWDGTNVFRPSVIKVEGTYHLFYSGSNVAIDPNTTVPYAHGIGHASSTDGVNWTKDLDNPIFIYSDGVEWRNSRTYTPFVLYTDFENSCMSSYSSQSSSPHPRCLANFLKMWFGGGMGTTIGENQGIGYATWPCCKTPKITLPPSDFIGVIKKNEFATQKVFILVAKWKASPSPHVKSYRIFKNGKIVATIPSDRPLKFKINITKSKNAHFEIAAVSKNNIESLRVPLRIVDE